MPTQTKIIQALIVLWSKDPALQSVPIRRMAVDAAEVVEELERKEAEEMPVVTQITLALVVILFAAAILAA